MSGEPIHVYPLADLIEHDTAGDGCVCGPETIPVERDDGSFGWVISHHSLDGREHYEGERLRRLRRAIRRLARR